MHGSLSGNRRTSRSLPLQKGRYEGRERKRWREIHTNGNARRTRSFCLHSLIFFEASKHKNGKKKKLKHEGERKKWPFLSRLGARDSCIITPVGGTLDWLGFETGDPARSSSFVPDTRKKLSVNQVSLSRACVSWNLKVEKSGQYLLLTFLT